MDRSNRGIAFPVIDLGSSFNVGWALTDQPPAYYLASSISAAGMRFSRFFGSEAAGKDCRQRLYQRKNDGKSFHG
jgi:hypothetical protein